MLFNPYLQSQKNLHKALHVGDKGNDMSLASALVGWLLARFYDTTRIPLGFRLQLELGDPEDQG
jgi:hypothetical protein